MTYIFNNKIQNYEHNVDTSFVKEIVSTTIEYYKGTGVTYTPVAGASKVIIECNLQTSWNPDADKSYPCTRVQYSTDSTNYVDGNWASLAGTQMREGHDSSNSDYVWYNFMWIFILDSWSGERKLRISGRSYDSNSDFTVGRSYKTLGSRAEGDGSCPQVSIYSVMP